MYKDFWKIEIPYTPKKCAQSLKWLPMDTEELFYQNKKKYKNFPWTIDDITYDLNSYGYRSVEFSNIADFTIMSIGCSYTVGIGLPKQDTFTELFSKKIENDYSISVNNFNLAWGGQSNDYIARMVYKTVPILKPDLLLIAFSSFERREYVVQDRYTYLSYFLAGDDINPFYRYFIELQNEQYDYYNFRKNMSIVDMVCKIYNIPYLYYVFDFEIQQKLSEILNQDENYIKPTMFLDSARDMLHPGKITNVVIANNAYETFNKYIIKNRLCSRLIK